MTPEEIIKGYMDGTIASVGPAKENQLQAAIGKLSADRSKELTDAIRNLHHQIPITISELRETIRTNSDKMIASNERLSDSNESYAKWMKWLTIGLVLVGATQVIVSVIYSSGK